MYSRIQPSCVIAVDKLGFFSIGNTTRSNINLNFYEATIRSNGNITQTAVENLFGSRIYSFTVTVSFRPDDEKNIR